MSYSHETDKLKMTREQARAAINSRLHSELAKAPKMVNGYDSYVCPFCGNGSGEDGTGICTKDGKHYKCFKCGFYGDYIDILKKKHGTDNESEVFALYNLAIDSTQPSPAIESDNNRGNAQKTNLMSYTVDYTQFFLLCHAKAGETDYFSTRGLSKETIEHFLLGYDPAWKHPNATTNAPTTARVIIPTAIGSYLARAVDANAYSPKLKVGESSLFNAIALKKDYPYIFIVEGEFDALSVIEVEGQAVALGSTSNIHKLVELVKANPPAATLILALDNDDEGKKAQAALKERLEALKIRCIESNISGAYKDPNEALVNDREGFRKLVQDPCKKAEGKILYMQTNSVSGGLDTFMQAVHEAASTKAIPTGFSVLDNILDGGFFEGLYILGAVSSIGKTTFSLQIADQIALYGEDVIIFSLEMSKHLLISKSLSRLTFSEDNSKGKDGSHYARTSRQIMSDVGNDREKGLITSALQNYRAYSQNLYIYDDMANIGVKEIQQNVKKHISVMGKRPVVIIDYLQVLSTYGLKSTDKQNTDNVVLELKRMSMENKLPVLAISSFNRDNYMNPVNMASFKESGAIEYSSDVLLGLQFKGMDDLSQTSTKFSDNMKAIETWRRADCRELELKILKNRNGASGDSIYFSYYPRFNCFTETSKPTPERRVKR